MQLPQIAKYDQTNDTAWESLCLKRRQSCGQIELDQLEIPTVYKHSNVAIEKYKSNPDYFLPDGTPKRKFSLPKLSESIEQVKQCRYLRRGSVVEPLISDFEITNIFKSEQTDTSKYSLDEHEDE